MKTLTINPGVFNAELLAVIGTDKTSWGGEKHLKLTTALRSHLKDEDGNPAEFDEKQIDRLDLIFRPTEGAQRRVLSDTLEDAGYQLDPATAQIFALLFSAAQFADFLAKSNDPQTGKPFIVTEKKRGAKKAIFTSLITAPAIPTTESPTDAEGATPDDEQDETKTVATEPAPKPASAKPTPRK